MLIEREIVADYRIKGQVQTDQHQKDCAYYTAKHCKQVIYIVKPEIWILACADDSSNLVVVGEAGAGAGARLLGRGCVGFKSKFIDAIDNLAVDGIGQRGGQTLRGR